MIFFAPLAERDKEPVGGAARFKRCIDMQFPGGGSDATEEDPYGEPLVLFSGDCLNPSLLSTVTRGRQMAPVLKGCRVAVAVYGNHDFDFGEGQLESVAAETGAVWLLSNCDDSESGEPLAQGASSIEARASYEHHALNKLETAGIFHGR